MGSLSIQKGKRAERDIADRLRKIVAEVDDTDHISIERNQNQSAVGGADIEGLPFLSIEVKHHKTLALGSWWAQCVKQTDATNVVRRASGGMIAAPCLIYKQHGRGWRVRMRTLLPVGTGYPDVSVISDLSFDHFAFWLKRRVAAYVSKTN